MINNDLDDSVEVSEAVNDEVGLQVLATDNRLVKMPAICMNRENVLPARPFTRTTYNTTLFLFLFLKAFFSLEAICKAEHRQTENGLEVGFKDSLKQLEFPNGFIIIPRLNHYFSNYLPVAVGGILMHKTVHLPPVAL